VLRETYHVEPVLTGTEGGQVTLPSQLDPSAVRLTGNVGGQAPRQGTLVHHGWRVREPHFGRAHRAA